MKRTRYFKCLYQTPAHEAQGSTWQRRQKECRSQSWWLAPSKQHPPDITGLITHMSPQTRWQHTEDLHKFNSNKILPLSRESRHRIPPLSEKPFAIGSHWEGENQFCFVLFSSRVSLGILSTFWGRHYAQG